MESSSQQQPPQPSQESMALGLPEGFPRKRANRPNFAPLPREMQDRLDRIMLGEGQARPVPLRRPSWAGPEDGGPAWAAETG